MQLSAFDVLIGLRVSIIRRAADMLGVHFGDIRPHDSGEGTTGEYTIHIQCPWRFDGPSGTLTGSADLWEYAGPGERPSQWSYEDGLSLQDQKFHSLFSWDESTRSWLNHSEEFVVIEARQSKLGDLTLALANGCSILLFPASCKSEAWRLMSWDSGRHIVFPTEEEDFAVTRRRNVTTDSEYEVWLRIVEAPKAGTSIEAPPAVIISENSARYRCGRCGTVLLVAEFGALRDFVVHCQKCGRFNEVPL